jgi:low affinity Fe/Cu permease
MNELFSRLATQTARQAGRASTFVISILIVLVWALSGPFFGWSDTWQLVINTGTTIVTFLMVFLIQNTQNRDTQALHLKLDELIRASTDARNSMINLEDATEKQIEIVKADLHQHYVEPGCDAPA